MFRRGKKETSDAEPSKVEPAGASHLAQPSPPVPPPAAAERPPGPTAPVRPDAPRPAHGPTAAPSPASAAPPAEQDARQLIVGKGIALSGEIASCDRLVVEGRVEATLSKMRSLEIATSGVFKGAAEIEQATIAGQYEGKLNCRGKLTIRSSGRIDGEVRYGEIEIEPGGVIGGNVGATTA